MGRRIVTRFTNPIKRVFPPKGTRTCTMPFT